MTATVKINNPKGNPHIIVATWLPFDKELAAVQHYVLPGASLELHPYLGYTIWINEVNAATTVIHNENS